MIISHYLLLISLYSCLLKKRCNALLVRVFLNLCSSVSMTGLLEQKHATEDGNSIIVVTAFQS